MTATETIDRYVVDGSLVLHMTGLSFAGGKGVPFVLGGAGYIRELHDKNEVIETGREYHGGAGLQLWFGKANAAWACAATLACAGATGGADSDDVARTVPTAGRSLAYLF